MIKLDKKILVKPQSCALCDSKMNISYELIDLDQPNLDQEVSFYAPILTCNKCKSSILAPEHNIIQHEASCIANNVLSADEVKQIRNKFSWGANNNQFSIILGFGSSTIARYEACQSVPSKAHSLVLQSLKYEDFVENEIKKTKRFQDYLDSEKKKKYKTSKVLEFPLNKDKIQRIYKLQVKSQTIETNIEDEKAFIESSFG